MKNKTLFTLLALGGASAISNASLAATNGICTGLVNAELRAMHMGTIDRPGAEVSKVYQNNGDLKFSILNNGLPEKSVIASPVNNAGNGLIQVSSEYYLYWGIRHVQISYDHDCKVTEVSTSFVRPDGSLMPAEQVHLANAKSCAENRALFATYSAAYSNGLKADGEASGIPEYGDNPDLKILAYCNAYFPARARTSAPTTAEPPKAAVAPAAK